MNILNFKDEKTAQLVRKAIKTNANELQQLIKDTAKMLAGETGNLGNFHVIGKLVCVKPFGEAIVVGDIHGELESLTYILNRTQFISKAQKGEKIFIVFLGDYGDRGLHSCEVYYTILRLKQLLPLNVLLMRGNHEGPDDLLASPHDLPIQFQERFGEAGLQVYRELRKLFGELYNAVIVDGRYLMIHGGVPVQARSLEDLAYAHMRHPKETLLEEMLWSDPTEDFKGAFPSPRGAGKLFGEDITSSLLERLNVKLLIRGHEPCSQGFKTNHDGKVLTLFSRRGPPYYNEFGAYLHVDLSRVIESAEHLSQCIHKF